MEDVKWTAAKTRRVGKLLSVSVRKVFSIIKNIECLMGNTWVMLRVKVWSVMSSRC